MAEVQVLGRLESVERQHAVEITRSASGYQFTELEWTESKDDVDRRVHGAGYWRLSHFSGLYETAEDAERDARQSVLWLKESDRSG